jgi:hypothetical protein
LGSFDGLVQRLSHLCLAVPTFSRDDADACPFWSL